MAEVRQTEEFNDWLAKLRDHKGRAKILARIKRLQLNNFGDVKSVGNGVWELRVHSGPGYRVYYMHEGNTVVLLLCGGDKDSQRQDIARAVELVQELRR